MGFKYLRLYTDFNDNKKAIKLYENMGFIGEKYTKEILDYDCRIYSTSLIDGDVPLWNNEYLSLAHQSELDQMNEEIIESICEQYDRILDNKKSN